MESPKRIRRSHAQWQAIIQDWQHSQLSASDYCAREHLSYGSFCQWRRRLVTGGSNESPASSFIDLSSLKSAKPGWTITLTLGDGVKLVLNQG